MTHKGHLGLLARLHLPHLVHHSFLLPSHDVVDSSEGADDTQASLPFPSPAVAADGWQEQEGDRLWGDEGGTIQVWWILTLTTQASHCRTELLTADLVCESCT